MVHSNLSVQKASPIEMKSSSVGGSASQRQSTIRRKRLSEPRPHPSHCLNKRFWDEVRAGRVPKPRTTNDPQGGNTLMETAKKKVLETRTDDDQQSPLTTSQIEMAESTSTAQLLTQPNVSTASTNTVVSRTLSSTASLTQFTTSSTALVHPFFGLPPPSSSSTLPHLPTAFGFPTGVSMPPLPSTAISSMPTIPFWNFLPPNGLPYQITPPGGFVSLPPPPFYMPFSAPSATANPPRPADSVQHQSSPSLFTMSTTQQPDSNASTITSVSSPQQQAGQQEAPVTHIQFVPIPIPIPIPLTTDFVMKHFGKGEAKE